MCQVTRIFKSSKTWSLILFRSSRQITGLELFSLSCLLMWSPDVFPSTGICFQGIKIYKNDPIIFTSQIATKERYNLEDCSSNNSCGPHICNASLKIATHFSQDGIQLVSTQRNTHSKCECDSSLRITSVNCHKWLWICLSISDICVNYTLYILIGLRVDDLNTVIQYVLQTFFFVKKDQTTF